MKKIILLTVLLSTQVFSRPAPITKPKYSAIEACQLVLKHYQGGEINTETQQTCFIRTLEYSTHQRSSKLQLMFNERNREKVEKKGLSWIYEEWGWTVEIVQDNDLSHTATYFLRDSGEIVLIGTTI